MAAAAEDYVDIGGAWLWESRSSAALTGAPSGFCNSPMTEK
jgi:hypothetical protein